MVNFQVFFLSNQDLDFYIIFQCAWLSLNIFSGYDLHTLQRKENWCFSSFLNSVFHFFFFFFLNIIFLEKGFLNMRSFFIIFKWQFSSFLNSFQHCEVKFRIQQMKRFLKNHSFQNYLDGEAIAAMANFIVASIIAIWRKQKTEKWWKRST